MVEAARGASSPALFVVSPGEPLFALYEGIFLRKKFGAWFRPPDFGDRELNRQAQLLNGVLLILMAATMALLVTLFFLGQVEGLGLALLIGAFGLEVGAFVLIRRKKADLAAQGVVYGLWVVLELSVFFYAGIRGPGVLGQLLLVMVAGLLISEQIGVSLGLLTIVVNYAAMLHQVNGGLPAFPSENGLLGQWVVQSMYFLVAIALSQISTRSIRAAMTEARWNEQVLRDRVAELRQAQAQLEMSEQTLLRREAILEAVGLAAERLFREESFPQSIDRVLEGLGEATGADRVYLFENHSQGDRLFSSRRAEWAVKSVKPPIDISEPPSIDLDGTGFTRWAEILGSNRVLKGNVKNFPENEKTFLEAQDTLSILVVPIFIQNQWWGFIGFDETKWEREWSPPEEEALRAAAGILGGAIERRVAEQRLNQSEARYLAILEDQVDIICRFTPDGRLAFGNNAFCQYFGLKREEVVGTNYWELVPPKELETVRQKIASLTPESPVAVSEASAHTIGDRVIWNEWTDHGIFDEEGQLVEVQAVAREVTEEVRLRERLHKSLRKMAAQAMTDPLTGLLNRRAIMDHAEAEWQRASREGRPLSLVLIDLDQLKEINDEYGHLMGDKVLLVTANLMQTGMRRYDWLGRWGGDEFLLVLPGTDIQEAKKVADRLHELIRQTRVKLNDEIGIELLMSIGVASQSEIDPKRDSLELLLARADEAMYKAKEAGRNRVGLSE